MIVTKNLLSLLSSIQSIAGLVLQTEFLTVVPPMIVSTVSPKAISELQTGEWNSSAKSSKFAEKLTFSCSSKLPLISIPVFSPILPSRFRTVVPSMTVLKSFKFPERLISSYFSEPPFLFMSVLPPNWTLWTPNSRLFQDIQQNLPGLYRNCELENQAPLQNHPNSLKNPYHHAPLNLHYLDS